MTTRELVRGGVRISYRTEGSDGPTVLFLPGFQIDSRMWEGQMSELASVARVVSYDPRGSGRSSKPLEPAAHTTAELLADALAVLGAAGADRTPAVLVVHGERDEIVPAAWGRAVCQLLGATFIAHPDAGHSPHLSYPEMVNSARCDFLASLTNERNVA